MNIETQVEQIDEILNTWQSRIGAEYLGYCGHVYRMFNFCLVLHPCTPTDKTKLAIAAAFHDIGLWSAHTVDYIPPSVAEAKKYLRETGREDWSDEIGLMIEMHHKLRRYPDPRYPLVEVFRKGDLVDVSLGWFRFGIPAAYVREVKQAIANHGFHRFLLKGAREWFAKHPLSLPPFMRW